MYLRKTHIHRFFTEIVKFMAPGLGVQALSWGQYGHIVKKYMY